MRNKHDIHFLRIKVYSFSFSVFQNNFPVNKNIFIIEEKFLLVELEVNGIMNINFIQLFAIVI